MNRAAEKFLRDAQIGDRIIKFGNTDFDGAAEVIEIVVAMGKPCIVKARTAGGQITGYPCAGMLGATKVLVAA